MKIQFAQVLECVVERTDKRAHDRMDSMRNEVTGLLGVDAEGNLWQYNYNVNKWSVFSNERL